MLYAMTLILNTSYVYSKTSCFTIVEGIFSN